MKAVRLSRTLIVVIALVVSLGANLTLFVGGVLYSFVDKFVEQAFDLATAAGKQRKALTALKTSSAKQAKALATWKAVAERQRGELSTLRATVARQSRKLAGTNALSARQQRKLAAVRTAWAQQGRALNDLKTALTRQGRELEWEIGKIRNAAGSAAKESRKRLVKAVGRSIVTAPVKALPYAGAAAIVGFTAWEISVFCKTIRDMEKIQKAAGATEAEAEIAPAVCASPEPAVKRAVATMKKFSKDQWDEIRKHAPDLPGWDDIPDSWLQAWRSAVPDILRDPGEVLKRLFPALDDQAEGRPVMPLPQP